MKRQNAVALAGALVMALGGALPAWAQSGEFDGFYCQMDLASAGIVEANVAPLQTTTDSRKVCSGGSPPNNIHLECRDQVENWPRKNVKKNVSCQVYATPCGIDGFLDVPHTATLHINPTGKALLKCHFKP
jgi:hypothetical protein